MPDARWGHTPLRLSKTECASSALPIRRIAPSLPFGRISCPEAVGPAQGVARSGQAGVPRSRSRAVAHLAKPARAPGVPLPGSGPGGAQISLAMLCERTNTGVFRVWVQTPAPPLALHVTLGMPTSKCPQLYNAGGTGKGEGSIKQPHRPASPAYPQTLREAGSFSPHSVQPSAQASVQSPAPNPAEPGSPSRTMPAVGAGEQLDWAGGTRPVPPCLAP